MVFEVFAIDGDRVSCLVLIDTSLVKADRITCLEILLVKESDSVLFCWSYTRRCFFEPVRYSTHLKHVLLQ